jgi:hypothetical protein
MKFEITPEEAQPLAVALVRHYKKREMKVKVEHAAFPDAPYRTTVVAEKAGLKVLVEVQSALSYGRSQKDLAAWLAVRRHYAEFYIATGTDSVLAVGALQEMKTDGVGLLIVDGAALKESHHARNAALVIVPEPTLTLGSSKKEVSDAVKKFNDVDRRDGLRDMFDIVERLTKELGLAACRKGWLKMPTAQFQTKDWSTQINELARPEAYNASFTPLIVPTLKDDLHSFRGGRNLVDHPPKSHIDNKRRQRQFAERMMQGPRLVAELLSLRRRVK